MKAISLSTPGWLRAIVTAASSQVVIQGIGFVTGVLLIRMLSVQEYALYTIALASVASLSVLTDGGLGSAVLAQGGIHWRDRKKLGQVVVTSFQIRKGLSFAVLMVGLPLLLYLLLDHGLSVTRSAIVCAAVVLPFWANLTSNLLIAAPLLHQALGPLRHIQAAANGARLVATAVGIWLLPFAACALVVTGITQYYQNQAVRRLAEPFAELECEPDPGIRRQLWSQLRRTFPEAAYTAFSGQITIFLASVFGATESVASLGALGRVGIIVSLLSSTFGSVATPRFARLNLPRRMILVWFLRLQGALIASGLVFMLALAQYRDLLLEILGPSYAALGPEIVLIAASSALAMLAQQTYSLASVRGLVPPQLAIIAVNLAVQAGLMLILNVSTLDGLLWLGIWMFATQWLVNVGSFIWNNGRT